MEVFTVHDPRRCHPATVCFGVWLPSVTHWLTFRLSFMSQNLALILCCTYSKYICIVVVQHQIKQHGLQTSEKPHETDSSHW